jgi:23S rRNA pseudouridine2605 synthase
MPTPLLRINRALALAGVASRRGADELVRRGRVTLNGAPVIELATLINPRRDQLAVDGKPVKLLATVYFLYYKPRGMICTQHDELDRWCTGDVCRQLGGAPRTVGRLDRESEGLLLLTNDGELANRLMHPRYGVRKQYLVNLAPVLTARHARAALSGVELEDGPARLLELAELESDRERSRLQVTVAEGRNRLIRRLFEALGYEVKRLKRISLAGLALGQLKPNEYRELGRAEVAALRRGVGLN